MHFIIKVEIRFDEIGEKELYLSGSTFDNRRLLSPVIANFDDKKGINATRGSQ